MAIQFNSKAQLIQFRIGQRSVYLRNLHTTTITTSTKLYIENIDPTNSQNDEEKKSLRRLSAINRL